MTRMTREQAIAEYHDFVDDFERLYKKNDNPLYAWSVIHLVTGLYYEPPLPMPPWCQQFLADRAAELMRVVSDHALTPQERADEAAAIFA